MFCHLHLHSEYSLLDGACRIADIPKKAKALGQTAVAITDHGVMYGAVDFYRACINEGIKPIIGCEVYVAQKSRFDKRHENDTMRYHLVLLCKNETGYKNLCYMVSKSFTEGFYIKPRIDMELLREHSEGLICLSACLGGYIPRLIALGETDKALENAIEMEKIFGKGNFYLELQDHGIDLQETVNSEIVKIHEKTDIPLVATNDAHYINKSDAYNQAVLMCIQTNTKISDGRPKGFETDEFYMKSEQEMLNLFPNYVEAIENTQRIADLCNFSFEFTNLYLPRYTPETNESPAEYLRRISYEGFDNKCTSGEITFTKEFTKEVYISRIEHELSVIISMGYAEYYLIVADFVGYAKKINVPTGPGRGSGASSIVAFLIGITEVDSIKFNLVFERFLNSERVSMPDFDIDFCDEQRFKVIEYVSEKYGKDNVCGITTFGTLSAKAVIRDVGRALGMSYADADIVARAVPNDLHVTLKKALEGKLGELYEQSTETKRLVDISMALEGMPRHASAHAAGIVITDKPVYEYVPVSVNSDMMLTQFPMTTIADLGLLKFDFLGLRYLTIVSDTEAQIKEYDDSFDIKTIPLNDEETYKMLSSGKTDGVFQLESAGIRRLLTQMHPKNIEDIILAIAIYRPGPMDSIPMFLSNRMNPDKIEYKSPVLEKVLSNTSGCIIYQEQVMQICREIAGFSFGRADIVRRAMSKKKDDEMQKARAAFIYGEEDENGNNVCPGAVKLGTSESDAAEIFDTLEKFSKYGFNKCHATAYAFISYRTAYLKAHYPCEFIAALLSSVLGNMTKTVVYITEAQKNKIDVLPPDINESHEKYNVVVHNGKKAIRFGLLGIKGVGISFVSEIIKTRKSGGFFTSFIDFIERMSYTELNKRQIEALIKSGAFDELGVSRSSLISEYEKVIDIFVGRKRGRNEDQLDMFTLDNIEAADFKFQYEFENIPEISLSEKIKQEKESTGMYFSGHPIDEYSENAKYIGAVPISDILVSFDENADESIYRENQVVTVCGIVTSRTNKQTRKGDSMAFVTIEDMYGEIELVVFPKVLAQSSYMISIGMPIAAIGEISLDNDETPKLLVRQIMMLSKSFVAPEKAKEKVSVDKSNADKVVEAPKTLYLKIERMDGSVFERVSNLLSIFPGTLSVVFFDSSRKKYVKANSLSVKMTNTMQKLLEEILGKENVILK